MLKHSAEFLGAANECAPRFCSIEESYTLVSCLRATAGLAGDIAELGVYQGGSAELLCRYAIGKRVVLFDTFTGMPDELQDSRDRWPLGKNRKTTLEAVETRLQAWTNVQFVQGVFPDVLQEDRHRSLSDCRFSFVHLDADIFRSTFSGLEFFWPRMVSGGRIVSHNYNDAPRAEGGIYDGTGVRAAFGEFFGASRHSIIEIADTQCMVIK